MLGHEPDGEIPGNERPLQNHKRKDETCNSQINQTKPCPQRSDLAANHAEENQSHAGKRHRPRQSDAEIAQNIVHLMITDWGSRSAETEHRRHGKNRPGRLRPGKFHRLAGCSRCRA